MAYHLTSNQRKLLVEDIVSNKLSIVEASKKFKISRPTVYKWLKHYRSSGSLDESKFVSKYSRKNISKTEQVENILDTIREYPNASKYLISRLLKSKFQDKALSPSGIYKVLKRLNLTVPQERFYMVKNESYHLTPNLRKLLAVEVSRGYNVNEISRKYKVSRPTIYRWMREDGFNRKTSIIDRFPRQATPEQEKAVYQTAVQNPSASKYYISNILKSNYPQAALSPSGVYKVLSRLDLTRPEQRLAWVSGGEVIAFTPSSEDLFTKFWKISRAFVISTIFVAAFAFSTFWWFKLVLSHAYGSQIGLLFASVALLMGSIFFLYSLKYYLTLAFVLSFSQQTASSLGWEPRKKRNFLSSLLGISKQDSRRVTPTGLNPNLDNIILQERPFISIHIPLYNEKNVVERVIKAATNFAYQGDYEVILVDDSTDETTQIIDNYLKQFNRLTAEPQDSKQFNGSSVQQSDEYTLTQAEVRPGVTVKHLHRTTRSGFKGGALRLALRVSDPRAEYVSVFDADFVPYPDTLTLFLKYFSASAKASEDKQASDIAAVQGYQWHVLNKSENWITRGVRSEYAGSYVIERSGTEIYQGLKQISGSVYMIRKDVLESIGWGTSITEDFELTLKLYEKGFKVLYTPYIQAPAECVSTIKRLVRQRMRWAEGHSHNIRRMFTKLIFSPKLTPSEKLEFLYLSPYYLQAFFFIVGTISWFISETIFPARLPFWTSLWGWSLVLTNFISLPLMNGVGMFLEESEEKDYFGILSFIVLSYLVVPFQAYASIKGFLEKDEGPWFRTPKTGHITDIITRGRIYRFIRGILPARIAPALNVNVNLKMRIPHFSQVGNLAIVIVLLTFILIQYAAIYAPVASASDPKIRTVDQKGQIQQRQEEGQRELSKPVIFSYQGKEDKVQEIFHKEPRVRVKYAGKELETVTVGSVGLGTPKHNEPYSVGSEIIYPEIFPQVDLRYVSKSWGVFEEYVLKEYKPLEEIQSIVRMVDVTPEGQQGLVKFVDNRKETVFTLKPPFMYEARSVTHSAISIENLINSDIKYSLGIEYEMHKTPLGWQLTKRLTEKGKKWLADPERSFPVVIDPSVIVSGGIVDLDVQFGGLQRKVAFVNGNWYAFHNDGADIFYKKSSDGITWGSNVDVDTTDADNYNASIWVKGNVIWASWVDDSADAIEFNSIDTANADALGTKCTSADLSAGTFDSTNMVTIAVQNTGTDIYVAQSDTDATPDSAVHIFQVTSACTFTDRTSGSGLTAGDRPVVTYDGDSDLRDDVIVVFQDGDLSFSERSTISSVWVGSNLSLDSANTDTTYSAISDGSTAWVLSQTSTTDTKFYRLGQFEKNIDTDVGGIRAFVDIFCTGAAGDDCQIVYFDPAVSLTTGALTTKYVDCSNASCSTSTINNIDATAVSGPSYGSYLAIYCPATNDCKISHSDEAGGEDEFIDCDTSCATIILTVLDATDTDSMPSYSDIYCISATDCKVAYIDDDNILVFVDCSAAGTPATCATPPVAQTIDANVGSVGGFVSLYCPATADCKVVYYDSNTTSGSIFFFDCDTSNCSTGTATEIDSNVGKGDVMFSDVDCTAGATECRVVYYDGTDQDVTFVDCNASATCAASSVTDLDTDTGQAGSPVRIVCNNNAGSPDDCKLVYFDATDKDVSFVDCANDACSTSTITDIDTEVGADTAYLGLDCRYGVTDCRVVYIDGFDKDLTYADCNDATCSSPTLTDIDTTVEAEQPFLSMDCPSATNCKIVYHDISENDLTFVDCDDATCSTLTLTDIDTNIGRMATPSSINCPTSDDCKIVYRSNVTEVLKFVDCNNETCSAPDATTNLVTLLEESARSAIDCPSATNCKVVYHDTDNSDFTFIDCANAACSTQDTGSPFDIDAAVGPSQLNSMDIDCFVGGVASADNCKIVYIDEAANAARFVDCGTENCNTLTQTDLDNLLTNNFTGDEMGVDCIGGDTDCKVIYMDDGEDDFTFIDCSVTACCVNANCTGVGETATVTDIDTNVTAIGRFILGTGLDCVSGGADNCKLIYYDRADATIYFVDCDTADCATRTILPLTATSGRAGGMVAMDCISDATDCKIAYMDISDATNLAFVDCVGEKCVIADLADPFTGQTNVISVSLTYDSTNDDIYAHIIQDATEQAYFKSTDASTISWSAQTSYAFTAGDLSQISSPMSGAGTSQIGVTLRQAANYEFSAVPENWQTVVLGGMLVAGWLVKKKARKK